jgi:hypothetical protein
MTCLRCHGLMVRYWSMEPLDETGQEHCRGWRCVNCGDLLDPVTLQNEARRSVKASAAALRA